MSIGPPQYHFDASQAGSLFVSGGATFSDESGISNSQFKVKNVYGKKKAKEECARLVVKVLQEILKRQEVIQRVQSAKENMKMKANAVNGA